MTTPSLVTVGTHPHTATYWGNPQPDGSGGESFDAPVTLSVRWEERAIQDFDDHGEEFVSNAVVYAKQDLDIGGYLYLGTSADSDPTGVTDAYKIRQFRSIPDRLGGRYNRKAVLRRR